MINVNLVLHKLWGAEDFKSLWEKSGSITKNKHWDLQLTRYKPDYLGLRLDTCWRGRDHAGFSVELILFGYNFHANIYDSRHWDYKTNSWQIYTGDKE